MFEAKNWNDCTEEQKQGLINDLPIIEDYYIISYWNYYVNDDNYHLSVYEIHSIFGLDFFVSDEDKEKAIEKAPKNWEIYKYISLSGEVFNSIWDYPEWKKYVEENGLEECAKFIYEKQIITDDFGNIKKLRENLKGDFLIYWEETEPIFKKVNKRLKKNGVWDDRLYIMSKKDAEKKLDELVYKLNIDEVYLLKNLIHILEAIAVDYYCDTATVNKYIKDLSQLLIDRWEYNGTMK